jgi:hypothetical protein
LVGPVIKTYNGDQSAVIGTGNIAIGNTVLGESITVANTTGVTGTYASANVINNLAGAGSVSASGLASTNLSAASGTNLNNYTLPTTTLTANVGTITPKALTLNGLVVANKTYDSFTDATIQNSGTLNGVIPHPALVQLMEHAAETAALPLQRSAHTGALTDLSYIQFMGTEGVACLDVGFPMRYSHSALEVVDPADLDGLVTLLDTALSAITPNMILTR